MTIAIILTGLVALLAYLLSISLNVGPSVKSFIDLLERVYVSFGAASFGMLLHVHGFTLV